MKKKVFIDGSAGTTGLRIYDRLSLRQDIEIVKLEEKFRKDVSARADIINSSDLVFLCLPDDAARESAGLVKNDKVVIIDTSTAHRTSEGWVYGFPEIAHRRQQIREAKRIANPGCHASGFIALAAPLVEAGVIKPDAALSCFSLTGYSGGGKKMIAEYEEYGFGAGQAGPKESRCVAGSGGGKESAGGSDSVCQEPAAGADSAWQEHRKLLSAPRMYGLSQVHKHLPEMRIISGLAHDPAFCPIVAPFYSGMEVTVPVTKDICSAGPEQIAQIYEDYYKEGLVRFERGADEAGFLSAAAFSGRDDMQISVFGNEERILLVSRFDNLGKGASGAAIQNMNLVLGCDEAESLCI